MLGRIANETVREKQKNSGAYCTTVFVFKSLCFDWKSSAVVDGSKVMPETTASKVLHLSLVCCQTQARREGHTAEE